MGTEMVKYVRWLPVMGSVKCPSPTEYRYCRQSFCSHAREEAAPKSQVPAFSAAPHLQRLETRRLAPAPLAPGSRTSTTPAPACLHDAMAFRYYRSTWCGSAAASVHNDEVIGACAIVVASLREKRPWGGSVVGHKTKKRDRVGGNIRLNNDYFVERPLYNPEQFRRRKHGPLAVETYSASIASRNLLVGVEDSILQTYGYNSCRDETQTGPSGTLIS